jgi:DNA end-binding protein Ku
MAEHWNPAKLNDSFTEKVMALVDEKVKKGQIETVLEKGAEEEAAAGAEVIDLTELLRKSLKAKTPSKAKKAL